MRPNRLGQWAIAAWLGVIALGLNALVPIHLAFDLAHALAPERHHHDAAADRDFVQCLLSLLTGHHDEADHDGPAKGSHHHDGCAVCGAIGTLAGLAPATAVVGLAHPALVHAAAPPTVQLGAQHAASPAAYRSRAPPFA